MYTTICKIDSGWEAAVQCRGSASCSVVTSVGGMAGRETQEGGGICIHTADLLR